MANKVYYKLGENASVFYDPTTRILLTGKEVIELDKTPKSKKFNVAKAGGHVVMASKQEFDDYQATLGIGPVKETADAAPKAPKAPSKGLTLTPEEVELKTTLEAMEGNQEIVDYFRDVVGFLDEDIEKLEAKLESKKSTLINLGIELNREYK